MLNDEDGALLERLMSLTGDSASSIVRLLVNQYEQSQKALDDFELYMMSVSPTFRDQAKAISEMKEGDYFILPDDHGEQFMRAYCKRKGVVCFKEGDLSLDQTRSQHAIYGSLKSFIDAKAPNGQKNKLIDRMKSYVNSVDLLLSKA